MKDTRKLDRVLQRAFSEAFQSCVTSFITLCRVQFKLNVKYGEKQNFLTLTFPKCQKYKYLPRIKLIKYFTIVLVKLLPYTLCAEQLTFPMHGRSSQHLSFQWFNITRKHNIFRNHGTPARAFLCKRAFRMFTEGCLLEDQKSKQKFI